MKVRMIGSKMGAARDGRSCPNPAAGGALNKVLQHVSDWRSSKSAEKILSLLIGQIVKTEVKTIPRKKSKEKNIVNFDPNVDSELRAEVLGGDCLVRSKLTLEKNNAETN